MNTNNETPKAIFQVLLVEDDNDISEIIQEDLINDVMVVSVGSLEDARRQTFRIHFDLIILDLTLPDGDGLGFCSEFRKNRENDGTSLIVITGRTEIESKVRAFASGSDDYLVKPFNVKELKARVMAKLNRWKSTRKADWNL